VETYQETLRRIAIRDNDHIRSILERDEDNVEDSCTSARTDALIRISALIAVNAALPSFMNACNAALAAQATPEEIVETLNTLMPVIGVARVVAAAPNLGLALGYDVSVALEAREPEPW
jgi:alkylhydroperoxidase/carboxymuconolactone decarboxylase family protein YurZ